MRAPAVCAALVVCFCGAARGQVPEPFVFGIEYALPGANFWVASHYTEIGATSSKFNGPGTFWGDIEPNPPVDGVHTYDWAAMDQAVADLHRAGFTDLTVVIGSRCGWGSESLGDLQYLLPDASTVPRVENWIDYALWVYAFVERYDLDGVDDMPGLAAPILRYEVLTEAQSYVYWFGRVEDYINVLKVSSFVAKLANPETQVILSGFWFADLFDSGRLSDAELAGEINTARFGYPMDDIRLWFAWDFGRAMDFNRRILQEGDWFDAVEFHLLNNYTGVEGAVDWLRREMAKNGYFKPIWLGDCGAAPQIPCHNRMGADAAQTTFNLFEPALYDDGDKIFEVLTTGQDGYGYTYADVLAWYDRDQACHLAKSLLAAMGHGLAGANVFTWLDGEVTSSMFGHQRNWTISGLRDGNVLFFGDRRPAFYTYKLIVDRLGGFGSAGKIDSIGPAGVSVYRFDLGGEPVYAAWYDAGPLGPGDAEPAVTVDLSSLFAVDRVETTRILTVQGVPWPDVKTVSAQAVTLTEVPVLLR